ncbi:MAG: TipAS antibiotic-recognition domain-containing protein [Spirochaetaceae bacterium]|nr:TipAS antibiotic-recognition domain-containing protein [Spirochaetaceae bacterium]
MKTKKANDEAKRLEEARKTWGEGPAWKESARRTASWKAEDWAGMKAEMKAMGERLAAASLGKPEDPEAQEAIKAYHDFIDRTFYTCPASMFLGLSDLWVQDERFASTWNGIQPGLADFLHDAVRVYVEALLLVEERY